MTRINTNVSSLVAQNTLGRSNASLNEALTRLSTGLRINTGKDDPAGLIASENLRSDITSIKRAISNTDRANQVIATADSALGQVSSLLNDIRGLVTESANTGVLSDEQIDANQLQLDSSLDALNRIAQTTTFQGRRLLDGSLDFITTAGTNSTNISNLKIDQANLGSTGSVAVSVSVTSAATQAQVDVTNVSAVVPAVQASDGTLTFSTAEVQSSGTATLDSGDILTITVLDGGTVDGASGDGIDLVFVQDGTNAGALNGVTFDGSTITVNGDFATGVGSDTVATAITAVNSGADLTVSSSGTADVVAADVAATYADITTGGVDAGDDVITISAVAAGAFNRTITFVDSADLGAGVTNIVDDGTTLTINVDDDSDIDLAQLATDIAAALGSDFTATLSATAGDGQYNGGSDTAPVNVNVGATTTGVGITGGISAALVLELAGSNGAEVLSFGAGTSLSDLVNGINLVKDATGVTATANGTTLELKSSAYGTKSVVDLKVKSEGTGATPAGTFTTAIGQGSRDTGTNIVATINGVSATGDGNEITINTSSLDLTASITAGFTGTAQFNITGGGALFQLGPDVVSNQQARLGIGSVNTASLGGVSGKLFQLGTGGTFSLTSGNLDTAAAVVGEAIDQVTSLRGRLGAFQRTTLETNKQALNDTLVNLTEAESSIRDADFSQETAALTRAQILVQSGTTVLQIANSNPQNVLALLR
ncbi:flagellin N-terminal helical domain-containing protein [Bythopirellula polymerisocia]|uniref:Flagellin n=1 Tax=Bythopirellula polymerisocia TaxID=2528003 RepID=A0A5C6CRX5_9BACT|nr:flagellin [Bythopirellula polymerisocia]TWU25559.1 A-type flagellin [Bythopirellula polymerisocia]